MDNKMKQKTLRMISNGMYILTSRHGEHFGGATVTWLSQASFKPPLIMAAIRRDCNAFECLEASRAAAIHILGSDQQELAKKFLSTSHRDGSMLNNEEFTEGRTLSPILANPPAHIECSLRQVVDTGGDHAVVVLEVVEAECRREAQPLLIAQTPWHYGG